MAYIGLTPELKIENEDYFHDVVIQVSSKDFLKNKYYEGRTTASFIGCRFRKKLIVRNDHEIDFNEISITFSECIFETIELEKVTTENISIVFLNSILKGRIFSSNILSIHINNCISLGLFLNNQNNIYISFTDENIFPRIWQRIFKRLNTTFSDITQIMQSFHIEDCKKVVLNGSSQTQEKLGFRLNNFEDKDRSLIYLFTEEEKKQFNIRLSIRNSLQNQKTEIKVSNLYLSSFELAGSSNGSVSVVNVSVNEIYITDFLSQSDVSFYNIRPKDRDAETKFSIHKSNLDSTWFDNVDFNAYLRLSFYLSKFAKTTFTSCSFPSEYSSFSKFMPVDNVHYPEKRTENYHKDQYEIFLQLKRSFENSGNYFEALKLHAISHEALRKVKNLPLSDRIILRINSCSNEHGLSIIRPFVWFFILSILSYVLYLISLNRIFNTNDFDPTLIGYYFSFIDITHRNDFLVDKCEFNSCSLAIDYIHKVLISFVIYQFVASFRKYGKK